MPAYLENSAVATGLKSFHSNPKEGQCQILKLPYNCTHFTCSMSCSKSFKLGFNSTWTDNFQKYKMDLEKTEEPEIKFPTLWGHRKRKDYRKTYTSASLNMLQYLIVWTKTNYEKFLERWEYQITSPASWENLYTGQEATVRKGHWKIDWFKTGKEYIKAV